MSKRIIALSEKPVLDANDEMAVDNVLGGTKKYKVQKILDLISSVAEEADEAIGQVADEVTDLKSGLSEIEGAIEAQPVITWTIGKEISASTGVPTVSIYSACSSKIACAKNSCIINKTSQKDANNKTLITYIALYNGDTFIRRDSIAYNATYIVADNVTDIVLSIGRYSSSGVTFVEADLEYFSYSFLIAPEVLARKISDIKDDIADLGEITKSAKANININWEVGKEISTEGVVTASIYNAISNSLYCSKGDLIINKSAQKDGNSNLLITYISLYRGGVFVKRDTVPRSAEYEIEEDATSFRLTIGRYSSSGVTFVEADIDYFDFDFYIKTPLPDVNDYTNAPEKPTTKYRYVWHDNFHRADNPTGLGTNGDSNYPMIYEYAGSQLAISGDACVNTASSKGQAYADMGVSDCVIEFEADLSEVSLTTRGYGVLFRRSDAANFLYCQLRAENIKFGKVESGTTTELKNIGITSIEKAPRKISVILRGSKIDIATNGVIVETIYNTFNQTATVHGIYMDGMTSGNNGKVLNFGVKVEQSWQPMLDQMDGGTLPYNIFTETAGQPYNFEIQNRIVNNSNTALRFENRKSDEYKRSEIAIKNYGRMLDEQIYEWDMMLDSDYAVIDPMSEIIMQMHDITDNGQSVATQPSFSIYIRDGKYFVHTQSSPYKTIYNTSDITSNNTEIGSYLDDVGKWVHWALHIKWAYNNFFDPFIYLYKNGKLVYVSHKPNVINAAAVPYFKIGIYTFNWVEHPDSTIATVRTMYVDNVKPSY